MFLTRGYSGKKQLSNAVLYNLKMKLPASVPLLILMFFTGGCSTPKSIVAEHFDALGEERDIRVVQQSSEAATVLAVGEDENCTNSDYYYFINLPEIGWKVAASGGSRDCEGDAKAKTMEEYRKWRETKEHNKKIWKKGAPR